MATILVVDDHSTSQRLLSFILQQERHTVITARNGRQALSHLGSTTFDLMITDLGMPEMDGLTLLRQVRASDRYRRVPVIILTGSPYEEDNARALAAGVTAFLTKPVESDDLLAMVQRLLVPGREVVIASANSSDVVAQR